MRKVTVAIERKETITLEVEIPEEVSRSGVFTKISEDPGDYLEKHLGNVVKDESEFQVTSLHFKD